MLIEKETKIGKITVMNEIIYDVIFDVLEEYSTEAWQTTPKGKKRLNDPNCIEIVKDENAEEPALSITLYVVIKFGASISNVANGIINDIIKNLEDVIGITPQKVTVRVTGVVSKKIARRNIVFSSGSSDETEE